MPIMTINTMLVDDHKIIRDGLRTLIEKEPGIEVIAEAESGIDAVTKAKELLPHVVIMDISLPDMSGIDATRIILKEIPSLKVVALSMYSDRFFVSGMLDAGASGYLLKDCAFEELVSAILTVMAGKIYVSSNIKGFSLDKPTGKVLTPGSFGLSLLTSREREVLQLVAEGLSSRAVAARLGISVKTVEAHRRHIMDKLEVGSISELVKYAIRQGIITA